MSETLAHAPAIAAKEPFHFMAASYLVRIRTERAWTPAELASHLRSVPPSCIAYHTFQSLEEHHYTTYSNDFAQWVMASCNETALGEQLGAIDLRDYVSLDDLRKALVETIENHLTAYPQTADRPGFEPFHFCQLLEVATPMALTASTLAELADGIERLSLQSLHFHFINSRIRLQLRTNDFSNWIMENFNLAGLAEALDHVDFYTYTLEGVRAQIVETIRAWIRRI